MSRSWIPRTEVLARLGVKPQTLYAYVSRGRIAARPDPENPRCSLYAAEDVARLLDRSARVGRPVSAAGGAHRSEAVIDTAISHGADGRLFYRGEDAVTLAEEATLEQACRVLWGAGEDPFADLKPRVDVNFPGGPRARGLANLARRAEEDAAAAGRSEKSLRREAAAVLNELVDAVAGGGPRLLLHQRLARIWKLTEANAGLLRRALVLSADQGLDAPTLAVRVTAQTGAALGACVLSGWAALGGPRAGGKLTAVAAFVSEAARSQDARTAARQRLAQGLEIPGFGGDEVPGGDPRARALIEAARLPTPLMDIVRVGEGLTGQPASFDLALALVGRHLDLPREGAFAVYAIGRTAGWLAHALEQAQSGSPIRARLRYVGPDPAQRA
ncbi:MAG: citrate synthase [Caulobacteraceae bacterium]|nr:citrate synthase [Caulobacteraceae bacterium]